MPAIIGHTPSASGNEPLNDHQQIAPGDDYSVDLGNALHWSSADFPDLAGAGLAMTVGHNDFEIWGNVPVTWTANVPPSPASPTTIELELTAAQTNALAPGQYDYQLVATIGGLKHTLAIGKLTVEAVPTAEPLFSPEI